MKSCNNEMAEFNIFLFQNICCEAMNASMICISSIFTLDVLNLFGVVLEHDDPHYVRCVCAVCNVVDC